mgnify:CR=1 FL=1
MFLHSVVARCQPRFVWCLLSGVCLRFDLRNHQESDVRKVKSIRVKYGVEPKLLKNWPVTQDGARVLFLSQIPHGRGAGGANLFASNQLHAWQRHCMDGCTATSACSSKSVLSFSLCRWCLSHRTLWRLLSSSSLSEEIPCRRQTSSPLPRSTRIPAWESQRKNLRCAEMSMRAQTIIPILHFL